ncbi:MAG: sugar ABC transporter permease [Caldilineaceae bacterium]
MGLLIFKLGPVLASLFLSFTQYDIISAPEWIGLNNYSKLLNDDLWLTSVRVTLRYVGLFVPSALVTAYAIAMLMSRDVKGIYFYRTIWYLPSVVPAVASATIWRWGLNPEFGPINYPLKWLGLPAPRWLTDPDWIVPSIVFISLWGLGNTVLIFLAAIKACQPRSTRRLKWTAGRWTLPPRHPAHDVVDHLLSAHCQYYRQLSGLGVAYVLFVRNSSASSAGPNNAALFYVLYMYRNAFGYFRNGYASAMAWVLFVVIMLLTALLFYSQRRWVYYETEGAG